jgi:hypothetical protein
MLELVAGAAVGLAALALVLEPLLRGASPPAPVDDDEPVPLDEVESPKLRALVALREIEFDRATGKLSDDDYHRLRARYAAEAMAAMRVEDAAASAPGPAETPAPAHGAEDVEALIRRARTARRACPRHGPRPEADAVFCSECGSALGAA